MAKSLSELKPKPVVVVEPPKPAAVAPTAPLPEPPIAAEVEPEPVVAPAPKPKKPAAPAVPAAVTPPVATVPSAAELLRESSAVNVIEPPKPKPAPKPSAASPMVETLATADYVDPMQAFADSIQVPLPTMRKRLLEFNADPENAGLPEDEWNRRAVDALIRISPRYDQLAAEPPKPPPLPTYGFAQTDGFVLWSAMRAEYEKEKYHGEKAKPPAQILIEYAQARGMKPAELAEAAKAAGTDLFAIQRVAREDRSKAESLAEFNRLRLGGRYTTPEKARQARVAEAVTKPPKEEDRSSLTVVMSNDIPFFAPLPDEDPELTHTAAGMRYAQDVIDHIPPSRDVIYDMGFQQYASDSRQVFLEAANDILSHGVSFEVKGIIDGEPGKKVIRLTSNSAAAALQAMKDNGFDVSGPDAMKAAAAVGNEAKRRAVARAVNEVAAKQINGHFASPVRASIPFSQMTNLAPPGGYDPLSDDRDTMWLNTDAVDDARSMVQRGDYLGAASQALAPTLTIAGYADIPGSSAVWPVLVREESNLETAADWTDIPYAAGKGALEPVTEAWERGDYAEAAANLTLAGFGRVENGRIVARSPDEILAGVAAAVEHRENSFADLQESDILTKYIETTSYGLNLARKMDFGLPDRFDIDYDGDGKIDAADRERGWTEYQDFVTFGAQNLAAFGGAVATLDMFDVLGAMQAGKVIRRLNRAIEYKPAAVNLMDEAKKALVKGDFEAAQKAEEQLEFRPGHSREKAGPARAHPEGQAPILGQTSRVVDSVLAHEAHELGKADEMFDTAIEGALPDIDPVVTSGPTPSNRRFYLHGSVRTSAKQYLTTEDLRARYAFRHFYNIVESMEAAIADGRATYKTRLLRKFAKPIKEFVTQTGLTGDAADALRKLLRQNVASGYSPMQIDAVLRAHLKGDAYDLANKAATDLAAAVAKEEADAVKEGRIAVERARRAVDQQVASRIASMQRTIDFVRGPEPGTAFGKWLHEKLPAVRNWFSRFREPENLVKVVESEVLQRATTVETPVDIPTTVKRLDTEEQTIRARTREVEAAQIAKDEAAEKKAKKLLKAATTRRNKAVRSLAEAINGRGHVLSDAGIEHFLRMRAADGGATDPAEIMFTTILIDLRAEKMIEEGTAKTFEEVHERFSWRRSDIVEPDALLQEAAVPRAVTLFSGGGLVEVGLRGIIKPTAAVEINGDIADAYKAAHGDHVLNKDVRDVDFGQYAGSEYVHASPVCKSYSGANVHGGESELDVVTARATARALREVKPSVFTLENVARYENSDALREVTSALDELGYKYDVRVYDSAEYGAPTSRKRLLLRAVREGDLPPAPAPTHGPDAGQPFVDWYSTIEDLVDDLPDDALAPWQKERLTAAGVDFERPARPLIVMGGSASKNNVPHAFAGGPAPTIKATPNEKHRVVLPNGRVKTLSERALARITGLPDDYPLPTDRRVARTIVGNGVPPALTRSVFGPLLTRTDDTSILRQDETPDFIEPERLSRGPRVVRGESGEMSVAALSKGTAAELNKMLLAFENATYIDPGSLSQARQLIAKAAGGRVSAAVYDNLREVVDDIVGDAAARLGDEVEFWERRWNVLRGQVTTGPTEPLSVLPPQKVPTDPVEMTRVVRDTPWFHGAVRGEVQLREYDPSVHAGSSAGLMLGPGLYLAENPEVAIRYATAGGGAVGTAPGKAALKTIMVSPERVLDVRPVEGRRYSDVLAERLEAVGLAEDARIVRDSRVNGAYEIGEKWLNRRATYEMTPDERRAADAIGLGSDRMTAQQIRSLLSRVADVTDESPFALLEEVRDAYRQADTTRARSGELYAKYASYTEIPEEVNDELTRLAHEQARLSAVTEKMDGIVDILDRQRIIVEDEIRDIHTNEILTNDEIIARWRRIVEAKKVLEGALEKAKNASSPTQRLLEHFDGLFHAGSQDGNVLVLFDPNGKIGGRPIITAESRVLPERVVYQTDDLADAKAYVQFEADGKALVTLMKKADASSFLHESAHIFRRTLDEKDNATILRWTKASGLDVELQNGLFVGPDAVKAEEMFARAFERFALEGKTAAKGLRRLFTNLRDVMLRIYRGSKALDVKISPEIEILFNRMISPKSVSTEIAPTIHTGATDMSAAKWLAGRSNGLLKPDELLAALEAGETVRLPFRVFGKDEIDINDLARLQVQIDTIAGSPEPVFKEPFKSARQQVVEPTLTGDIQSALSQDAPEGSIEKVGFHMTRGSAAVVLGADAMAQDRIFAPRFRELSQQGGRLLDQRVGDMNVFLREQEIDDGRVPVIRYMTGQAQNFRVGDRTPLSSGHDAVAEVGEIIEESAAELAQIKIQVSNAIDEAYENSTGVAQYVGPGGQVTGNAAAAAPLGQLSQEVAVIARRVTELPTADQRSNEVSAFFNNRPDRQRMVRGVVKALMTNGNVDKASATIFRHLGMALLNNGIMEGKSVDEVIRTAQVPKLLAYVDAVYRLGGFEVVDDMMVQNALSSEGRLREFIQVLDNAGFGPEGIDRALVVVNAFGAQKSIYAHVSDFGAAFSKEEYAAFNRFLNGDFKSAADYANGLRMFKQFGFNHDALEEAAGLIEGSKSRYIPSNVQKRIGSALGRALDETTDQKNSQTPEAARWLLSFWQRQVVRGTLLPKAAKAWMDNMDTFFMSAAVGGVEVGARAAMRQGLQTLFIGTRGHLLGWLTRTIDEHGSATDRIRSGLQNFGDWMASPTGQQTVNKILKGSDEIYRTADGRVYRHSDFLTAAIRHGTVSSFETSVLRESIRRSREATFIADEVPTTVAGRMYDLARERASQASHGVKNTLTDILHANSELFEAWAERERMGVMVTFAEAGMTPDKAARKAVEALFDYPGSLAASELKGTFSGFMLTLVQPFWPFVKNANHFAINAIEKPEILYRLTAMRRAIEYGQEAVAQTIYSFFVDPYGFDYAEMSPESRASYYMLRDAYEKSLGKLPHEMTVEERLKLAAIILSAQPESPFAVADGKHFRLPGGVSDITATEVSRLPGGIAIASSYRPEPRLENVPPYMQRRIRTLFPAWRTGAIESYIRATQQQDLQYAVAAFEPAPISGMNYLANTLALYGYIGAVMTTEQSASAEQSLRAIREFADPERMPLVADIAATFQVGQPERVSYALAAAMQQHPDLASWVYPVYDERTIPMTEYELSLGVDPDAAGVRKPVRWYTVNPTLSLLLRTVLYDTNTTALNMQQPGGAFARETNLEALRKVLYLVGPLKITEESQSRAASRAYYDLPPDARPR